MASQRNAGPTVQRVDVLAQQTAVVRRQVPTESLTQFVEEALSVVMDEAMAHGWRIAGRPVARLHRGGSTLDVEAGYPVAEPVEATGQVVPSQIPAGPAVTVLHVGAPDRLQETYAVAKEWMREHQLELADAPWESYLDPPGTARPRTAVFLPCARERIPQQRRRD